MIAVMFYCITTAISAQNVNSPAPNFTLNSLTNSSFTLSEQKGKVVFIFLFGWNCTHCKENGPNTQSDIYEAYKDNENFVAVGVETWDGNASATQSYVDITGIKYPILLFGSSLLSKYKTTYDRIIVVDQQGDIKYKSSNVANKTITAEANTIIASLLDKPTAIIDESIDENKFTIAPNPVKNRLTIITPNSINNLQKVLVFDLGGKVVLNSLLTSNQNSIDVSHLQPGYYTVKAVTDSGIFTEKFLKVD